MFHKLQRHLFMKVFTVPQLADRVSSNNHLD